MAKPLNENIREVRIVTADGDLVPVLDEAGAKFSEVIAAVVANNKAGSLTLNIKVKPSTAGALAVLAEIKITKPKGLPPESLLWPTPDNNLVPDDPRQTKLVLKPVEAPPVRELKTVGA